MSVKTKKYNFGNDDIRRGIRLTDINVFNVAKWCKSHHTIEHKTRNGEAYLHIRVEVKTPSGIRIANTGDHIVKRSDGSFYVTKAKDEDDLIRHLVK